LTANLEERLPLRAWLYLALTVRMARYVETSNSRVTDDYLELKRTDGSATRPAHRLANAATQRRAGAFVRLLAQCPNVTFLSIPVSDLLLTETCPCTGRF